MKRLDSIDWQDSISGHLDPEVDEIINAAYTAAFMPPSRSTYVGTEHLLAGFTYSEKAKRYLGHFRILAESVIQAALKIESTDEIAFGDSFETQKYREVFVLALALAFGERFDLNYRIEPRHLIDSIRRSKNNGAYQVLSRLAQDPNF